MECIYMPVHKTISVISEDFWKEMLKIAKREGKPLSTIIMDKLKEYRRVHGEGNPVYVLDKFIEDPDFKAVPATMEKQAKWVRFSQQATDETLKELEYQGMMIQIIASAYAKLNLYSQASRLMMGKIIMKRQLTCKASLALESRCQLEKVMVFKQFMVVLGILNLLRAK